jgi:hypothetical protein
MPLMHKPAAEPIEQPAAPIGKIDPSVLLAQLAEWTRAEATTAPRQEGRSGRRRTEARYDRGVRLVATVIGMLLCATAWVVGAYFTLSWLASLGFDWATAGIAPIAGLFSEADVERTASPEAMSNGMSALLVWAIPLAVTLAEVGFDPGRASGIASRLLWAVFLVADAATTALGLYPLLAIGLGSGAVALILAALIGMVLALVPEKLARRLIRENL